MDFLQKNLNQLISFLEINFEKFINNFPVLFTLFSALFIYLLTKRYILSTIKKIHQKNLNHEDKEWWEEFLFHPKVLSPLTPVLSFIILGEFSNFFGRFSVFVAKISDSFLIILISISLFRWLEIVRTYRHEWEWLKKHPVNTYIQVSRVLLFTTSSLLIVAVFSGQSPFVVISGLGAATALLALVFKDTILSIVASIQIAYYKLIEIGDWVEIPWAKCDGEIIEITIHTVKIENFDKTITSVPTYKLIEGAFTNYKNMIQSGTRRFKRAYNINLLSLKKLSTFEIENIFKNLKESYPQFQFDAAFKTKPTQNLDLFREVLLLYFQQHNIISKKDYLMVRVLEINEIGIPLEVYVFIKEPKIIEYENWVFEISQFIINLMPYFQLSLFQKPSQSHAYSEND